LTLNLKVLRFSFQHGMFIGMPNGCCELFSIYLSLF